MTVEPSSTPPCYVGQGIKRREDPKYLTGQSRYTDDLTPPDDPGDRALPASKLKTMRGSDQLRDRLIALGYEVRDTPRGRELRA